MDLSDMKITHVTQAYQPLVHEVDSVETNVVNVSSHGIASNLRELAERIEKGELKKIAITTTYLEGEKDIVIEEMFLGTNPLRLEDTPGQISKIALRNPSDDHLFTNYVDQLACYWDAELNVANQPDPHCWYVQIGNMENYETGQTIPHIYANNTND